MNHSHGAFHKCRAGGNLHAMEEMRASGVRTVTVKHDAANPAAGKLYETRGFKVTTVTSGFRRPLAQHFLGITPGPHDKRPGSADSTRWPSGTIGARPVACPARASRAPTRRRQRPRRKCG